VDDYSSILERVGGELRESYSRIDRVVSEAEKYVGTWLSYESLYNIKLRQIVERLGSDINGWQGLLNEIKQGRSTFDNSDTEKYFGAILIDYRLV
jgi:dynein heavy chain 1